MLSGLLNFLGAVVKAVASILPYYWGRSAGKKDAENEQHEADQAARERKDRARRDAEQSDSVDRLHDGKF